MTRGTPPAGVRYSDRSVLVGMNGSGKSLAARYLFSELDCQRLLFDAKNEWRLAGGATVRTPAALERALAREPLLRYVPGRADRAELEEVWEVLWDDGRRRHLVVWTDEAYTISGPGWTPRGLRLWQTQGRNLGLGHIVCTQRPRNIARELFTEAQHVFCFQPGQSEDADYMAKELGISGEELDRKLTELGEHGFLWRNKRTRELIECPPLPEWLLKSGDRIARQLAA